MRLWRPSPLPIFFPTQLYAVKSSKDRSMQTYDLFKMIVFETNNISMNKIAIIINYAHMLQINITYNCPPLKKILFVFRYMYSLIP